MSSDHWSLSDFLMTCALENNRRDGTFGLRCKMVPNDKAVCSDHADTFELDHFDQYFHHIFWLKVIMIMKVVMSQLP